MTARSAAAKIREAQCRSEKSENLCGQCNGDATSICTKGFPSKLSVTYGARVRFLAIHHGEKELNPGV